MSGETLEEKIAKIMAGQFSPSPNPISKYTTPYVPSAPAPAFPSSSKVSAQIYDDDDDEEDYQLVQSSTSSKQPKIVSAKSVKGGEALSSRPATSNYASNDLPVGSSRSAAPVKGNDYDKALMDALGIGPDTTALVAQASSAINVKPHDWNEHVDHIEEEYEDSSDEQYTNIGEKNSDAVSPITPVARSSAPVVVPPPALNSTIVSLPSRKGVAEESAPIASVARVASVQAPAPPVTSTSLSNSTMKVETGSVTKVQSTLNQANVTQADAIQYRVQKPVEVIKVIEEEYKYEQKDKYEYQPEDEYEEEREYEEEENADYDAGDDEQAAAPADYEAISPISQIDPKSKIMMDSASSQLSFPTKSVAFEIPSDAAFSEEAAVKKRAVITKPVAPLSPQGISPSARPNSDSFTKTGVLPNTPKKPVTPSKVVKPAGNGSVLQTAKSMSSTTKASNNSTPTRSTSANKLTSQRSAAKRESSIPPRDNTPNKYTTPSRGTSLATGSSLRHSSPESQVSVVDRVIRVAVRVRPFSQFEKEQAARRTISKIGKDIVVVNPKAFDAEPDTIAAAAIAVNNSQWANAFNYDHCLWSYDPGRREEKYFDQVSVHKLLGLEIVENALSGISCSCFSYGHTTTGKTYTLFGANQENMSRAKKNNSPGDHRLSSSKRRITDSHATTLTSDSGLVPRVFHDIVKAVKEHMVSIPESRIFFSYLEIYNEMVIDLLIDPAKEMPREDAPETVDSLKIREHPVYGPYVENLRRVEVFCVEDVFALIAEGDSNRATTQTAWSLASSRSHAIAQLELASVDINDILKVDPSRKVMLDRSASNIQSAIAQSINTKFRIESDGMRGDGSGGSVIKVQMVDLAGSEKDTNDEDSSSGVWSGMTYNDTTPNHKLRNVQEKEKKELKLIRRSLATLGFIIQSLAKGSSFRSLPYRDSVLTFLLRDALNGHNHTTMIATISPAHMHYEETLSTLRYAEKLCSLRRNKNSTVPLGLSMSEAAFKEPRSVLIENFRRFHSEVSINFKGSMTQRQLLQQTLADPQQRIAKLTRGMSDNGVSMFGDPRGGRQGSNSAAKMKKQALADLTFTSPIDGSTKKLRDITADDLEHLQSSYRDLQGQTVELQIDLDALRTDRDTLVIELRNARNQLLEMEEQRDEAKLKLQNATKSSKGLEKEAAESRVALKRREEEVEKLLTDLQEQKQARSGSEHAYHARTKEFLARFDSIKKENKALSAALELANNRDGLYGNEKLDLVNQVNRLKGELEAVHKAIEDSQREAEMARQENIALIAHMREVEEKGDSRSQLEKDRTDLIMKVEALQCELQIANTERDSLSAMVKQKDSLLWLQTQQSEASIKMLQQRQAALERAGSQTNNSSEDFTKLVDSLKELFAREGQMAAMEALDTQKLLVLIKELKEKLTLFDRLEGQFSGLETKWQAENNARRMAEEKNYEMNRALQNTEFANSELSKQLVEVHRELEATRRKLTIMAATSGNNIAGNVAIGGASGTANTNNNEGKGATATGSTGSSSVSFDIHNFTFNMEDDASVLQLVQILETTRAENLQLKSQLETANKDASAAKDELQTVQMTMQREFAALWMSVQELNKLDAMKDKSIQELITERTNLTNDRDIALERLHASNMECDELRRELQEVDLDLQRAVGLNRGALHSGISPNTQNMMNVQPMFDNPQQQSVNVGFGGDRSQYYLQSQGGRPPLQQTIPMANGNNYRSTNGNILNTPQQPNSQQQQQQSTYSAQSSGRSVSSFGDTRTTGGNLSQVSSRPSSAGLTTPMTAGRSRPPPPTIDSGYGSGGRGQLANQSSIVRQAAENDDQDGLAEQLLMHQIEELSGFLQDEERLKRMRLMRSSTTNTGLPSPAPAGVRANSIRSTGVDPRNGSGRLLTPSNQRLQEERKTPLR